MPRTQTAPKTDEHAADPKEAAAAVDAKARATAAVKDARGKQAPTPRTDQKTIDRAVELYDSGMGLVKLARQLEEEGFKSATGKTIRPQTIRQWLTRAKGVDKLGPRTVK